MPQNAADRAVALSELDDAIRKVKRHQRESRDLLGVLHGARARLVGVDVQTIGENGPSPAQRDADERTRQTLDQLVSQTLDRAQNTHGPVGGRSASQDQDPGT
ncbi:MAG: hypothetical protein ACYCQK_01630 [Acidiferrobacteraceae bacterium]